MNHNIKVREVLSFIYEVLKPYKLNIIIMILVAITWAINLSLSPYILKKIIDSISSPETSDIFASVGYLAIAYFMLGIVLNIVFRSYDYFVSLKMIPNLRKDIALKGFSLLLKQNYTYYQNNFAGSLTNKIKDITSAIPEITQIIFDHFFSNGLALIIAIATLWNVNAIFALGMTSWAMIVIIGSTLLAGKLSMLSDTWSEYGSRVTGKLSDSFANILSVHLFARSEKEAAILEDACLKATKAEQRFQWHFFWIWLVYGLSFALIQGINLYFLIKLKQEHKVTVGDFIVVMSINAYIGDCLWVLAKEFNKFAGLWGKITQSLRTIQVIPEISDKENATILNVTQGKIVFDNIKFHYKDTDPLFQNKSVTILPGQKIGLVGYSGSGKSSFVNLILRLFDITEGRILIDDQDIRDVTQESLRSSIAMIPQDPALFHRSLEENIAYGLLKSTKREIIEASKRAHAHEFITKLPEGYESLVGERGVKISGGQRQRIAIARAILKNAPILILDEATSQLDSVTESYIQDSLWELMQGKTSLVIAHRLSTLLHMDRILVFDQGKITEDGTHEQLLAKRGLYKTLWDSQVGGFLPDNKEQ